MVRYLVKEITGSVRWTSLRDKASEGHAIQNLGQKVVLDEASLAQEGSLDNVRIGAVRSPHRLEQRNLIHMDIPWNEKQAMRSQTVFRIRLQDLQKTHLSEGPEINIFYCLKRWISCSACKKGE